MLTLDLNVIISISFDDDICQIHYSYRSCKPTNLPTNDSSLSLNTKIVEIFRRMETIGESESKKFEALTLKGVIYKLLMN